MDNAMKKKTIEGLFWRFGERIIAQLITFIVSVMLARILVPEQYGTISIVNIFISLANVLVTDGLGTSLIQKKDADELDFCTMFYASMILSVILYGLLFVAAPFVATVYNNELLTPVLRVMGVRILIAGFNSIQQAYVSRNMVYKKFFYSTLFGTVASAFIGIGMAYRGYGVWALVAQYTSNNIIDTIVLFITIEWRPKFRFSIRRFWSLYSYGWKVMCTGFIGTFFEQLRGLIIGVRYTSADLAFFNKGEQIPGFISGNINQTISSVMFPAISAIHDNEINMRNAVSRMMEVCSYITMPLLFGVATIAPQLIRILLTDKWLPCIPFLQIICVQQCFAIISTANLQAIKASGRSDILLKLEFIKKPFYFIMLIITMHISPIAIVIGNMVYTEIALIINSVPNKINFNYGYKEQWNAIGKNLITSLIMSGGVYLVGKMSISPFLLLPIQIICGLMFYILLSMTFKNRSFLYMLKLFHMSRKK